MTVAVPATTRTSVRLSLPDELFAHFEAQAFVTGVPVEDQIIAHLTRTRDYSADSPIYLDDVAARKVRQLLGARINTPAKLVDMIERLTRMKVAGRTIDISPARQEAIVWWAKSAQLKPEDALPMIFDQALGLLLRC